MAHHSSFKAVIAIGIDHLPYLISCEHPNMFEILGQMNLNEYDLHFPEHKPGLYSCLIQIRSWQDQTPDSCDWNMDVDLKNISLLHNCNVDLLNEDPDQLEINFNPNEIFYGIERKEKRVQ